MGENSDVKLYKISEVADFLKVHDQTIRRYIKKGELKAVKVGKQWLIKNTDLNKLIKT